LARLWVAIKFAGSCKIFSTVGDEAGLQIRHLRLILSVVYASLSTEFLRRSYCLISRLSIFSLVVILCLFLPLLQQRASLWRLTMQYDDAWPNVRWQLTVSQLSLVYCTRCRNNGLFIFEPGISLQQ